MKKIISYISGVIFILLMAALYAARDFNITIKESVWSPIIFVIYLALAIGSAIIFVFSQLDYGPAGNVIGRERVSYLAANWPIIVFIFVGSLVFISLPLWGARGSLPMTLSAIGAVGLILALFMVFSKSEIILMEEGFVFSDSISPLRNRIFRPKSISYSSVESLFQKKCSVLIYLKGGSFPISVPFNFTSKNMDRIVEILKSKGVKGLNDISQ